MSKEKLLINNPKSNNSEVMRNKQIEEMTEILKNYTKKHNIMASVVILESYAEELYNKNFRKQSENTVEVVRCKDCEYFEDDVIDDIHQYFCNKYNGMMSPTLDGYCSCGELKMKGGAE